MTESQISYKIIGAAIELHRLYGPGLLESAWRSSLAYELRALGLKVEEEVSMPFVHKNLRMDVGYRLDLVVEGKVIVEIKNVEAILNVHEAQVLTYLKLSGIKLGLIINFNTPVLHKGIKRFVNKYEETDTFDKDAPSA
ncbi:MAG: GxxExxY protein [Bacteroidetes bacterium]|nr:GxxExxY protein [Bacteroidota bacterium]